MRILVDSRLRGNDNKGPFTDFLRSCHFQVKRDSADDECDRFGRRRDLLVAAPGDVPETPSRFVVGDDPHPQFVRDEDHRTGKRSAGVDQLPAAVRRRLLREDLPSPLRHLIERQKARILRTF